MNVDTTRTPAAPRSPERMTTLWWRNGPKLRTTAAPRIRNASAAAPPMSCTSRLLPRTFPKVAPAPAAMRAVTAHSTDHRSARAAAGERSVNEGRSARRRRQATGLGQGMENPYPGGGRLTPGPARRRRPGTVDRLAGRRARCPTPDAAAPAADGGRRRALGRVPPPLGHGRRVDVRHVLVDVGLRQPGPHRHEVDHQAEYREREQVPPDGEITLAAQPLVGEDPESTEHAALAEAAEVRDQGHPDQVGEDPDAGPPVELRCVGVEVQDRGQGHEA